VQQTADQARLNDDSAAGENTSIMIDNNVDDNFKIIGIDVGDLYILSLYGILCCYMAYPLLYAFANPLLSDLANRVREFNFYYIENSVSIVENSGVINSFNSDDDSDSLDDSATVIKIQVALDSGKKGCSNWNYIMFFSS
jgi:hypothetical protein